MASLVGLLFFSVFSYPRPKEYLQAFLDEGNIKIGSPIYYLFYNEPLNFARGIMGRFFNHFSERFLFFEGDWANPRHTPPYQGVLVIGDVIFLILGVVGFVRQKLSRETLFVWLWLVLAVLPAILSRDQVHAVRSFNLAIPLIIIIAFGVNAFLEWLKAQKNMGLRISIGILVFGIYAATYVYFLDAYFVHQPAHSSALWQYGYKQMVQDITPIQKNYKDVIVQQSYDQPYIYFLFYQKYDPSEYQKMAQLKQDAGLDVGHVEKLDNICFCAIDWSRDRGDHGALVVADTIRIPIQDSSDSKQFELIDEIKYLNGVVAWRILGVK